MPVLGVNGALVGNISAKDLRNLVVRGSLFSYLHQPVRYVTRGGRLDLAAVSCFGV